MARCIGCCDWPVHVRGVRNFWKITWSLSPFQTNSCFVLASLSFKLQLTQPLSFPYFLPFSRYYYISQSSQTMHNASDRKESPRSCMLVWRGGDVVPSQTRWLIRFAKSFAKLFADWNVIRISQHTERCEVHCHHGDAMLYNLNKGTQKID